MIARQPAMSTAALAVALLDAAAEVERHEAAIKQVILDAAKSGDCARVIDIVTRWQSMPAAEVLRPPTASP